jgi:uncharacterized oxidoreductase
MPVQTYEALRDLAVRMVVAMGAPPDEAVMVAEHLARSNLVGHDSHGVIRLEQYARLVREGAITPGAPTIVAQEGPSTALLDGGWNFGQVVASRAIELGVRKARQTGSVTISVRNSNHLGRLGEYTLQAAEQGMVAIACINNHGRGNLVAPWGGRDGRLATNPISIACPGPERPLLLDITTSVVAEGKVRLKRNAAQPAPAGWLINNQGEPTTNPADLYTEPRGAILPFGGIVGHKGYGLAVMVDVLSGALSGAGCSQSGSARLGNAMFITVVDIERFLPLDEFKGHAAVLVRHLRGSPLAPGFSEILMPGEIEAREEERRRREGIDIDDETWRHLIAAARDLGIDAA